VPAPSRPQESIPQHRSTLNLVQSDQMNRVLFFLTLITATSVPVTFLTGLWGMNFV
jgi:Mg2+ and Co2+ transporter CorA